MKFLVAIKWPEACSLSAFILLFSSICSIFYSSPFVASMTSTRDPKLSDNLFHYYRHLLFFGLDSILLELSRNFDAGDERQPRNISFANKTCTLSRRSLRMTFLLLFLLLLLLLLFDGIILKCSRVALLRGASSPDVLLCANEINDTDDKN